MLAVLLCACGQDNRYVAPPPPKVTVAIPVQQPVTRYLEATGNAAAVNTTNLVARVQGFLQQINYEDGDLVKEGAPLFTIEPEPYKLKLEQAQAAEVGAAGDVEAGARRNTSGKPTCGTPGCVASRRSTMQRPIATPHRRGSSRHRSIPRRPRSISATRR